MTAYGAVLSLKNTINNILRCPRFSLVDRSRQIIDVVRKGLEPLKKNLETLDYTSPSKSRKKVNALDGIIKEAIWKFEDSLESLLTQQTPSQSETIPVIVSIDLQSLQSEAHSLIQTLEDMQKDYIHEVENMPRDEPISSVIGFHGNNSKMIGLSDQFQHVKTDFMQGYIGKKRVYALNGTAGVGKTTLAMQIYQDPEIQSKYERRAWVTVGRVPQPISQISRGILAQLCGISDQGDEEIGDCLEERLDDGKKCLVVLDDVWEEQVFNSLLSNLKNASIRFLLTGRHRGWMLSYNLYCYEVRFLNQEESMHLLCDKVFGEEIFPPQLQKAAAKIAKQCEGLPLMIVAVADILSKSEQNRDPVYWNEVAERRNSVFTDAYNEISKVLFPSYGYLPQGLKTPFLFMGVFPSDYDTPYSKIIMKLAAVGLSDDWDCLGLLGSFYSLALCTLKSVDKTSNEFTVEEYKTCRLHSSWRYVCRVEASRNKFYHVLNKLNDDEGLKDQRGVCLENNILFGIREFRNSVTLYCASSSRSLLFYGPYQQYPVCINVGFVLLREIDALTQRFYTFPMEILSLIHLKYLALTCNGELPPTISKLFNLRALIIHPHLSIRRREAPSCVPVQIWDMRELEHIEILGKSLVSPPDVASLEKLSTLVGVNASICTVLNLSRRIPNIKKLGIRIELTPYDDHNDVLSCFGCTSTLRSLKTLKISIANPVVKHGHVFPVTPGLLKLPRNLEKLHLSGMGFPWEYMNVIGSLPSLKALKLRSYAFQGSRWETQKASFRGLEFLLIEESDLEQWKPGYESFPKLTYLSMKHCYKLKEIHKPASLHLEAFKIIEIELEDCNPLALTCACQLQPDRYNRLQVIGSSSFYEKPTTVKFQSDGDEYADMGRSFFAHDGTQEEDYNEEILNMMKEISSLRL
ncbi:putative late blight resistance protein homolog R1A-10 [Salvia hispanica]|uniref:putative late blight resistance protein homolog R1A-10 n=1 Tax=Salvia hispanica TaxID=49212 RepID=UPI0020096D25|nr:putative late blight resistance protein homolog R1A-10 [Salvia hispanica]